MQTQWSWLLIFYGCFLLYIDAVTLPIVDEEVMKPQEGQICGFGDMNKDRYTDLIVQSQSSSILTVLIQSENGKFTESKFPPIKLRPGSGSAVCAVADFNGDALPDIMVTYDDFNDNNESFKSDIYINDGTVFVPHRLHQNLAQPPTIVDINGDGIADLVGFLQNRTFFCLRGDHNMSKMEVSCADESFPGHESLQNPFKNFPHIFADLNGDLSSEIIFALESPDNAEVPHFEAWKLRDLGKGYWERLRIIPDIPVSGVKFDYFGSGVVADFDADGSIDLLIPVCRNKDCKIVEYILIYSEKKGWVYFQIDLKDAQLVVEKEGPVFRVGDFTLDGYPDLIATVSKGSSIMPVIFENVEYTGNQNFSRKFEMMVSQKVPQLVIPAEMAQGKIRMAAFFDLKEDGTLDILVEYTDVNSFLKFNFIRCDDKGDTTFLKVQIFTNVCTRDCKNSKENEIGSGISWHGACAYFSMPDSYGNTRLSAQCQLPQTSQRALHSPFLLFGLGRSPNFIDEVKLGSPRLPDQTSNQHTSLKQIVPNSRIIVVPPEGADTHWQSRLYLTPSQLIIQSVAVLFSVCVILIILIVFLHYRERQQDRKERQAQLHRFHFDAM
uniref:T-cell immunomodulatory protein n=1 Tax=Panagrolaimus superbus TaxID=310955 RepID=A0A914YZ19_9BILA